jgi:CRISP-associated protein Cas1
MILVVDRRGCTLRYESGTVRVECAGEDARRAPIAQLELAVIYGNPLAETAVWRALANAGVPVVMLPARGRDGPAVLAGGLATQLPLRRLQHRRAADPQRALGLARWVLRHKLLGYDLPLAALRDRHAADPAACAAFLARRDQALAALAQVADRDAAMGVEGQIAHAWFGLAAQTVNPAWRFSGRNRRPPRDPVNALLSLGYTLVGAEIHHCVMASGLDPSLGFLHQPAPGRESMVLDLVEIFRGGVDDLALRYIDPAGPNDADWYYRETEGCRASKAARPRFYGTWAARRAQWPYPLRNDPNADPESEWPWGGLREQINGWIERLRAEMKCGDSQPDDPAESAADEP